MTNEFKEAAMTVLRETYPFADEETILRLANFLWDLIPEIYNGNENDQKHTV